MPVGCSNDSFWRGKKSPAVCSQSMRMKSGGEEKEEEDEDEEETVDVTSPLLYSCNLIQFHQADLTKARTRAP